MNNIANQRIAQLRERMAQLSIDATIIPQTDPHQSEYIASHWQVRRWFSGFTGSAGTLVVTRYKALLWVDSRYFLQAAQQLEGSEITMMKIAIEGTPTINEYLTANLKPGNTVGIDGLLFSTSETDKLSRELSAAGISLNTDFDPTYNIWTDRPTLPDSPVIIHGIEHAGKSAAEKLEALRGFISQNRADALLISALDEIAWILNIRSRDVRCNPVATAYLLITPNGGDLFINPDKIKEDAKIHFDTLNISIHPYTDILQYLRQSTLPVIIIDPSTTSASVAAALGDRALAIHTPVQTQKAIKNSTQIQGTRQAMVRDGVALVKGFMEIERRHKAGEPLTEITVAEILHHYRSQQELFFDDSFDTIAGYGAHGAIVHYSATPETDIAVEADNLLLIDSGAQYLDGTTDITRTIILGEPSQAQRRHFTLVLKGNIDLARAIFPVGTRGTQLDALAHLPLWQNGLNYLHGTGHGVGHFLNVHEGPHSIRTNEVPATLQPGMYVTDEPGLYLTGRYGIRCENTLLVTRANSTEFGEFLTFEPLTMFPFDRKLIDTGVLDTDELKWLNDYHAHVREALRPHLNADEQEWLERATAKL